MSRWIAVLSIPAFAGLMALCAQVDVPMTPVPMTLQSWAVILAGAALGLRGGVAAVLLYLCAAALGAPVLSEGSGGLEPFSGATAGYIAAFPLAAALAGWRTADASAWRILMIALVGHAVILGLGAAWLARSIGVDAALSGGLLPFLPGAVVKSAAVAAAALLLRRLRLRLA